ncbi:NlpC/P60 family protein [Methylophaga frappieri]|nr:NlpC/P60 family protein [Methylophaga frappieri]
MFLTSQIASLTLRYVGSLMVILMLAACQGNVTRPPSALPETSQIPHQNPLLKRLYQHHAVWQGTPYQLGGNSRAGIDCSAFVQLTYRELWGIDLPRTTAKQRLAGKHIPRANLKTGDLVFFRNAGHVGIYLQNNQFLHASTSSGVMISNLYNAYWSRHFSQAIRIAPLD